MWNEIIPLAAERGYFTVQEKSWANSSVSCAIGERAMKERPDYLPLSLNPMALHIFINFPIHIALEDFATVRKMVDAVKNMKTLWLTASVRCKCSHHHTSHPRPAFDKPNGGCDNCSCQRFEAAEK